MEKPLYEQDAYRYKILFGLLPMILVSNLHSSNFSAITSLVEKQFNISSFIVSLNFLATLVAHLVFMVPVNWLITKQGLRISCYIASFGIIVGVWLRTTLSTDNPYLCLAGSFISATSSMILSTCRSKILVNWFRAEMFSPLLYICSFCNVLSVSTGLFLPGLLLSSSSSQADIIDFLRLIAIIVTVPFLLFAIIIREKPQSPPSKSADLEEKVQNTEYKKIVKRLFRNQNYIKMVIVGCFSLGGSVVYLSTISKSLVNLGYAQPSLIISKSDITMVIFGVIGAVIYSIFAKDLKRYKLVSILLSITNLVGFAVLNVGYIYQLQQTWQIALLSLPLGFNYYSQSAFFVTYLSQLAFPVDQASIFGYFVGIAETFGLIMALIFLTVANETREDTILILSIVGAMRVLSLFVICTVKEDLRKDKFEAGELSQQSFEDQNDQSKRKLLGNQQTKENVTQDVK